MLERKSERIELISPNETDEKPLYDLSKTGVCCYYSQPKEKNSFVTIKINELILRAKVIYCQKCKNNFRLGLQFWNVAPERQMKLNELVEKYSKGVPIFCKIIRDNTPNT